MLDRFLELMPMDDLRERVTMTQRIRGKALQRPFALRLMPMRWRRSRYLPKPLTATPFQWMPQFVFPKTMAKR